MTIASTTARHTCTSVSSAGSHSPTRPIAVTASAAEQGQPPAADGVADERRTDDEHRPGDGLLEPRRDAHVDVADEELVEPLRLRPPVVAHPGDGVVDPVGPRDAPVGGERRPLRLAADDDGDDARRADDEPSCAAPPVRPAGRPAAVDERAADPVEHHRHSDDGDADHEAAAGRTQPQRLAAPPDRDRRRRRGRR